MISSLEYHISVRRSISAAGAFLSLLILPVLFISSSHAQINGVPSSVTSPGFGGRAVNGTPPSVTSLGPKGFAPRSHVTSSITRNGDGHHRHHFVPYAPPVAYAVPVPYAVDIGATDDDSDNSADDSDDSDANYQGGPTIFDRRGSGARSYIPPDRNATAPRVAQDAEVAADPDPPQQPTLLIFKNGRKLEVGNYAIVGATLFDLTPGHARKVALADLDLDATRQQNDDRGIVFQLPPISQAN